MRRSFITLKAFYVITVLAMTLLVIALTATSLPAIFGDELAGNPLMAHMMASGGLVFALPVFAWLGLTRLSGPTLARRAEHLGFWTVVVFGWATIATVFLCMLPVLGTDAMHHMMQWHGYAGLAMVPAMGLLLFGWLWSSRHASRSAKPG